MRKWLRRKLLGDEHPAVAHSLNDLAALPRAKRDYAAAEPLYREALAIRERKLSPAHVRTADTRTGLGRVLTKLGRFAEAEALLLAAQETCGQTPSPPQRLVRGVLERLVELYEAWHAAEPDKGHDAQAAEWRAKLEQWQATTQPTAPEPAASRPGSSADAQTPPRV